ncbi:hypothetical protein [Streptomyces canus]|uniref:hypothetical protein n=1 Tax=Streptomyces canus TaxID=58343 RepID=UPI003248E343
MTHRRLYWIERRFLARSTSWPSPHPPRSGEPQLLLGLQVAGTSEDAVMWLAELTGGPGRPAAEKVRLRQAGDAGCFGTEPAFD